MVFGVGGGRGVFRRLVGIVCSHLWRVAGLGR